MSHAGTTASNVRRYTSKNVFNGKRKLTGAAAKRHRLLAIALASKAKRKTLTTS